MPALCTSSQCNVCPHPPPQAKGLPLNFTALFSEGQAPGHGCRQDSSDGDEQPTTVAAGACAAPTATAGVTAGLATGCGNTPQKRSSVAGGRDAKRSSGFMSQSFEGTELDSPLVDCLLAQVIR